MSESMHTAEKDAGLYQRPRRRVRPTEPACDMGCQPDWHHDDCAVYLPAEPKASAECERCEGTGLVWYPRPDDPSFDLAEDCPSCEGHGTRVTPPGATP